MRTFLRTLPAVCALGLGLICACSSSTPSGDAAEPEGEGQPRGDGTGPTGDDPAGHGGSDGGSAGADTSTPAATARALAEAMPKAVFDRIFLHRGDSACAGSFYTYEAFIAAAASFPNFFSEGTPEQRKRELAAFLANISHETTGGWDTAPDGRYAWGLCFVTEGGKVVPDGIAPYCVDSAEYPCAAGKKYYGRGPIQLSYNFNYGACGKALGLPLLADPDKVAQDPVVAFKTAFWFWMTTQAPKPSCHDVMTGRWTPSAEDTAAGRAPGFGMTINVINGGIECNGPTPPQVEDRVGFYRRYSELLGTTVGENVYCDKMQRYP